MRLTRFHLSPRTRTPWSAQHQLAAKPATPATPAGPAACTRNTSGTSGTSGTSRSQQCQAWAGAWLEQQGVTPLARSLHTPSTRLGTVVSKAGAPPGRHTRRNCRLFASVATSLAEHEQLVLLAQLLVSCAGSVHDCPTSWPKLGHGRLLNLFQAGFLGVQLRHTRCDVLNVFSFFSFPRHVFLPCFFIDAHIAQCASSLLVIHDLALRAVHDNIHILKPCT